MAVVVSLRFAVVALSAATVSACSASGTSAGVANGRVASGARHSPTAAATQAPVNTDAADRMIVLGSHGLGPVEFGTTRQQTTARLMRLLGPPSGRGINTGCGPTFTEVQWGELAVEFHNNVFSGYRDMNRPSGNLQLAPAATGYHKTYPLRPAAQTAAGIQLGDSLGQVRVAYSKLSQAGANRHHASNGLNFVDDSSRSPAPPAARIIEIRIRTCGDY